MDPVGKKKRGGKRGAAQISAAQGHGDGGGNEDADVDACSGDEAAKKKKKRKVSFKPTFGKTGVEFRYYKPAEFSKLTDEQKAELKEHRRANGNYKGTWKSKKSSDKPKKNGAVSRKVVAAMMREHDLKKQKESEELEELKAAIVDEIRAVAPKANVAQTTVTQAPSLKRILKRAGANAGAEVASAGAAAVEPAGPNPFSHQGEEDVAERCANKLYAKFKALGSRVNGKSG